MCKKQKQKRTSLSRLDKGHRKVKIYFCKKGRNKKKKIESEKRYHKLRESVCFAFMLD